jgi:two-component system sensor histidine kinase BaeS
VSLERFDRLHVKLFLVIAGAIAGLTVVTYLVFTWSFERGFVQYVNRADEARLELMTDRLADVYAREGGFTALARDGDRWMAMSRDALGLPSSAEPGQRRELPLTIDPRLLLFDASHTRLIGSPEAAAHAVLKPIDTSGTIVGYLGYVPRVERLQSLEQVYLRRQHQAFAVVAVGMVLAALGLAAGLAYWLTRRVRALVRGTNALIHGDYTARVTPRGHDELARLARDFNTLAATLAAAQEARERGWPTSPTSCARRWPCCAARSSPCRTACARSTRTASPRWPTRPHGSRAWSRTCTRCRSPTAARSRIIESRWIWPTC